MVTKAALQRRRGTSGVPWSSEEVMVLTFLLEMRCSRCFHQHSQFKKIWIILLYEWCAEWSASMTVMALDKIVRCQVTPRLCNTRCSLYMCHHVTVLSICHSPDSRTQNRMLLDNRAIITWLQQGFVVIKGYRQHVLEVLSELLNSLEAIC